MRKKILSFAAIAFVAALGLGAFVCNTNTARAAEEETAVFKMVEGAQVRMSEPSGIRFVTEVNAKYQEELAAQYPKDTYDYVWGTNLKFTDANESSYDWDAATVDWKDESHWYTALVGIPETDYLTAITAESYVRIYDADDVLVYSDTVENAQTRSIAQTASLALNSGNYTDEDALYAYTDAIPNAEVAITEESGELLVGTQTQLNATVTEGYGIAWRSSDTSVATVDKDGKVTAVSAGTATITARLGTATDTYELTVTESAESALLETFYYRKGTNDYVYHNDFVHAEGIVGEDKLAYGSADLGGSTKNVATMYMTLSSEYMATLFADAKITEIKFDAIISVDAKKFAITRDSSEKVVLTQESTSSAEVNGVTYYTYTLAITREYYETYCVDMASDMTLRYTFSKDANGTTVEGSTNASTFFYIANVTAVEGEIVLYENKLVKKFYTGTNVHALTDVNNVVSENNVAYGNASLPNNSTNSSTMYFDLSYEYLTEIFADPLVDSISFDIILDQGNKQIQGPGNANEVMYDGTVEPAPSVEYNGKTYYVYTVSITRERYNQLTVNTDMKIRYTKGTRSLFVFVDNLRVVK